MPENEAEQHSGRHLNLCGQNLRLIRLAHGLTLIEVQERLQRDYNVKIHRTNIGRIENKERSVTDIELAIFAHLFGVSLEQLLWGEEALPSADRLSKIQNIKLPS